jgi:hypothetical protein
MVSFLPSGPVLDSFGQVRRAEVARAESRNPKDSGSRGGIAKESARAGVHRRHEHNVGGKGQRASGAADGDDAVFERLAQHFERALVEFGEFVEEQHAAMRQTYLAGARHTPPTDQASVGYCVSMYRPVSCR